MPTLLLMRLGAVVAVLGMVFYAGYNFGSRAGAIESAKAAEKIAEYEQNLSDERASSVEQARKTEQQWREAFDANARRLNDEKASISASLELALNGLRSRAMRTLDPSGNPRTPCNGSSGAELSREDAEFLVREAARADTIRSGLSECYANIDSLRRSK